MSWLCCRTWLLLVLLPGTQFQQTFLAYLCFWAFVEAPAEADGEVKETQLEDPSILLSMSGCPFCFKDRIVLEHIHFRFFENQRKKMEIQAFGWVSGNMHWPLNAPCRTILFKMPGMWPMRKRRVQRTSWQLWLRNLVLAPCSTHTKSKTMFLPKWSNKSLRSIPLGKSIYQPRDCRVGRA